MSAALPTVGVLGGRGHVGAVLLPLLLRHGGVRVAAVVSRSLAGRPVAGELSLSASDCDLVFEDLSPQAAALRALDAWVLALPNGEAAPYVAALLAARPATMLIDLSADYRFDDAWQYGLVERRREALRGARRIANPGCYATGMQLGLAPLLPLAAGPATVFGVSGYSGAGTTPSPRNDPAVLQDNLLPYSLTGHVHEREATHHLGHPVAFMPHVAPFFRGITLTLTLPLKAVTSAAELCERTAACYQGEPLVRVETDIPLVRACAGSHELRIGGFAVGDGGRRAVVVAVLDNLLKGAATQALQNLNLALGQPELAGIAGIG